MSAAAPSAALFDDVRPLVETLPLVVYAALLDDDRPLFVSPQVEALLCVPVDDYTFGVLLEGVHRDDRERVETVCRAADAAAEDLSIEFRYVRPDGSVIWIEDTSRVAEVGGAKVAHGYLLDITERKQHEELIENRAVSRRRIVELGRTFLEGASRDDVIRGALEILRDGAQADVGAFLERVRDELVVLEIFGWDPAETVASPASPSVLAAATRMPYVGPTPSSLGALRDETGARSSIAVPVFGPDGDCVGVLSVHSREEDRFGDDEVNLVEQVGNLIAAVVYRDDLDRRLKTAERLEAVGQLAAGVAHDFNNLLTAIAGYTQLSTTHVDEQGAEYLAYVARTADRARELTSQLLAFSRKQVVRPRPVELGQLVGGALQIVGRLFDELITVRAELDEVVVLVDEAQLENVLVNLAANARDAMPDGGTLTVATRHAEVSAALAAEHAVAPGAYGAVTVADTGGGIPPEVVPRVFEPFFTTKERGRGTGLGLSSVFGTVHQNGGFVTLDTAVGRGTAVTVYLPVSDAVEKPVPAEPTVADVAAARILLVEDDDTVRRLVEQQLEVLGHAAIAVARGDAALRALDEGTFDLVLSDIGLPGLSGADLAEEVATRHPDVRLLLMSGYPGDAIRLRARAADVPLLQKPFRLEHLRAALADALV
jgi:signal transduction histidine kinase